MIAMNQTMQHMTTLLQEILNSMNHPSLPSFHYIKKGEENNNENEDGRSTKAGGRNDSRTRPSSSKSEPYKIEKCSAR